MDNREHPPTNTMCPKLPIPLQQNYYTYLDNIEKANSLNTIARTTMSCNKAQNLKFSLEIVFNLKNISILFNKIVKYVAIFAKKALRALMCSQTSPRFL